MFVLLPLQGVLHILRFRFPRVLPWADSYWPLDKSLMLGKLIASNRLLLLYRDFQAVVAQIFYIKFYNYHIFKTL